MKKIHFDVQPDGFYGAYWKCKEGSDSAVIAMLGDDPEDYMARSAVKWLAKRGVNVLTMSPGKKNYSHHSYPLERVERAVKWLKSHGNKRVGIIGASTTGTLALTAASFFNDITLTVALTPSDFIWQGFEQGKKDGCKEWPIEGESLFTYRGKPLPYMPFKYKHPEYGQVMQAEAKRTGDIMNSLKIFNDSEKDRPHPEEEMIKVEKIKGKLVLVGASDDVLWNTVKYIRRMEKRLEEKPHDCDVDVLAYDYGTHFVFPQSLLKSMFPVGADLFVKLAFKAAKAYPEECKQTRIDIDKEVTAVLKDWCKGKYDL